jgi:hypothetical protein
MTRCSTLNKAATRRTEVELDRLAKRRSLTSIATERPS